MWKNQELKKKPITELISISISLQGKAGELEKEILAESLKARRARVIRNLKDAQTYAENTALKHGQRTNYLHLSARLSAIVERLNTQFPTTRSAPECLGSIIKSLESYLVAGNLQKLSETMDLLERQFAAGTQPLPDEWRGGANDFMTPYMEGSNPMRKPVGGELVQPAMMPYLEESKPMRKPVGGELFQPAMMPYVEESKPMTERFLPAGEFDMPVSEIHMPGGKLLGAGINAGRMNSGRMNRADSFEIGTRPDSVLVPPQSRLYNLFRF